MKVLSLIATVLLNVFVLTMAVYIRMFPLAIAFFLFCLLSGWFVIVKGSIGMKAFGWGLVYGCLFIVSIISIAYVMAKLNL